METILKGRLVTALVVAVVLALTWMHPEARTLVCGPALEAVLR